MKITCPWCARILESKDDHDPHCPENGTTTGEYIGLPEYAKARKRREEDD